MMKTFKKALSVVLALLIFAAAVPLNSFEVLAKVVDNGALYLDEPREVTIDEAGDSVSFEFTPTEDGRYTFYSSGDADTKAYLYEETGVQVGYDDDNGQDNNFSLSKNLTAGVTYTLEARFWSGSETGSFTVCVIPAITVVSYEFHDIELTPGANTYLEAAWDEYGNCIGEWECYEVIPYYTITYSDGTTEEVRNDYLYTEDTGYYMDVQHNQSYTNQWQQGGSYTVTVMVEELGFTATFTANVVAPPVASVQVKPIQLITDVDGSYQTDYYQDESGDWVESDPYFYYGFNIREYVESITLCDGTVIEDYGFDWNGEWEYVAAYPDQTYDKPWTVGNTYQVLGYIAGYTFYFPVEIIESPVVSVEVEPIVRTENLDGYYETDRHYNNETGEWEETPEYFCYRTGWVDEYITSITLRDGTVLKDTYVDFGANTYYLNSYNDQSYENQWSPENPGRIECSIAGYEFVIPVIIEENPVASVQVNTLYVIENGRGSYTYDEYWDDETEQYIQTPEYFYYDLSASRAVESVTLIDGTVVEGCHFEWKGREYGFGSHYTQTYENRFVKGNTYQLRCSVAGYYFDIPLQIVDSPVASVEVEPIVFIENGDGCFTTSESWDEEAGEWVESPEYFYYYGVSPEEHVTSITLKDGTVIEGNSLKWEDRWYYVDYDFEQTYENRFILGETGYIECSVGGYEFTVPVEVVTSPVASVQFEPLVLVENTHGYYTYDEVWDEENECYLTSPEYFYYDISMSGVVKSITLTDGTVIEGNEFEWNDRWYGVDYDFEQTYENRFILGETGYIECSLAGYEFTVPVEVVKSPVASVEIEPIVLIENANGGYTYDEVWDEENECYVNTPEYFYYDISMSGVVKSITLTDGTVIEGNEFEWNDRWYYVDYEFYQNYENRFVLGETGYIECSIAGYEFTVPVEVVESPVASVEVEPIVLIENSNGYWTQNWMWDDEVWEEVLSPQYFYYYGVYPGDQVTSITLTDGTVIEGNEFEWNDRWYYVNYDYRQRYENRLTLGENSIECSIAGYEFTVPVEVQETPVVSVQAKTTTFIENMGGGYYTDEYYDEELGEYVETPEYYHYDFSSEDAVISITLKDGTVVERPYFEWHGRTYRVQAYSNQSYDNQWTVDNTYEVDCSIAGYEFTAYAEIVESPVASVTVQPIVLKENRDGDWDWDWIYSEELGDYVESPLYFRYNFSVVPAVTITLVDGTVVEDGGFWWNGEWYGLTTYYYQNYENRWLPGNTYTTPCSIAGYEFTVPVTISAVSADDTFEYMETEDGVIITDCYAYAETMEIPAEINGKAVIGVASLGYDGYIVRHLVFPDSVKTIGDYVLSNFYNLETVTFGTGISNLTPEMFYGLSSLREISVPAGSTPFCTVDGVLYNRNVTKVLAYPVAKGNVFAVPNTVVDVSVMDAWCYSHLILSFEEGNPFFVTVDGVTYNAEMTKVLSCVKDKSGVYVMPDTVVEIAEQAFFGCYNLTEVVVSSQVSTIMYGTFASCASLEKVDLPDGLISIEQAAFADTDALESIELPGNLEYIGASAFVSSGLTSLTVPNSVDVIGGGAFAHTNIATLDLGKGVSSIYDGAFYATPVTAVVLPDSLTYLGGNAFANCTSLRSVSIGSGLREISWGTFQNTGLESVVIPGTVQSVGGYAFENSALSSVTLEEGITTLGYYAFYNCDNLTSMHIPSTVTNINELIFGHCDNLATLTVAEGNPVYHSAGNCIINTAGRSVAFGCKNSVIPTDGSVTAIGTCAFAQCTTLTNLLIPNTITEIGMDAFVACVGLEHILLPNSLEYIGDEAFASSGLTEIVIPDNVAEISGFAFAYCENLTQAVIGDGVEFMGDGVFYRCPMLQSVDLGNSITYIPSYGFEAAALSTLLIPNSVTDIMYGAFADCSELTSIELPLSVETIEFGAFHQCTSLQDVYYEGTEEDRANMDIDPEGNEYLLNATWHYGWTNSKWGYEDVCEHTYDHNCDTDCNLCGAPRVTYHVYANNCDTTCDTVGCGFVRSITHIYAHDCDPECNVCGEPRPVSHVFTDDCDSSCNTVGCGYTRPASHQFDNVCDENCNLCGEHRPAEHVFSYVCDGECDTEGCGYTRPVIHTYDHLCDPDCNVCGDVREIVHVYTDPSDTVCDTDGCDHVRATFAVDTAKAKAGDTVTVAVRVQGNTGVSGIKAQIAYDSNVLELLSAAQGDFTGMFSTSPVANNPAIVVWQDISSGENTTKDGALVYLTFRVKDEAQLGNSSIEVDYLADEVYDIAMKPVDFAIANGGVEVIDYISGDVDGNGMVNNVDLGLLLRHVSDWDVDIDLVAADVNRDGVVNNQDLGILLRYVSGWDVELK